MKKGFLLICIALLISPLCFGQYRTESNYEFEDTGRKPEKKTPSTQGNFEVIQGKEVRTPIDMDKFSFAIEVSMGVLRSRYEVTVHQEGTGFVFFRARRAPAWVDIKLCYWGDEYWYEYWDSYRMSADPIKNVIHKTYRGTIISTLEKALKNAYR